MMQVLLFCFCLLVCLFFVCLVTGGFVYKHTSVTSTCLGLLELIIKGGSRILNAGEDN